MTNIIDTNIIIRFLVGDADTATLQKCKDCFQQAEQGKLQVIILESVIMESLFVLTKFYNVSCKDAVDDLVKILLLKGVVNDDKFFFIEALHFYLEHTIDYVDSLIYVKAKYLGCNILTLDKKLQKLIEKNVEM